MPRLPFVLKWPPRCWMIALTVASVPLPALAEDKEASKPIIVTARRDDERSSEVPLALDVVSSRDIGRGAVTDLQTLASRVPSLSFESAWGGFNAFPVLRGQSQPSIAGDNVGMFVDGVYQASRDALDVEPLDLDRIEVVHGPQSALFGHSTFAGLISYVPALPTEVLLANASVEVGTDSLLGQNAVISGPIDARFSGRFAMSWRSSHGTWDNAASPRQELGNAERLAFAASIATREGTGPLSARLLARYQDSSSNQPPFFALDYRTYNCGGIDGTSGAWSYYCGAAPIPSHVAVSPRLPDSDSQSGQVALHLALDLGGVEMLADSSFYQSESDAIRDLDGSVEGDLYGVCLQGVNCNGVGSLVIPVVRLQYVNIVLRRSFDARELAQEVRVRSVGDGRVSWQLGAVAFRSRTRTTLAFGGERGALSAGERFSSLVLSNPQRVGPAAAINAALVEDPALSQVVFSDSVEERTTLALFGTADFRVAETLRLRGEIRSTWEKLELDSRISNFNASFGGRLGPRHFHDVTPRLSLDWRPDESWLAHLSYARGSRSGGINPVLGLVSDEQTFEPETNWTAELGLKYFGTGLLRGIQLAVYDIDWRNTQIQGNSATPGVTALITRNTRGIDTQGIEAAAQLMPSDWLALQLSWSYNDPRFKAASEGPGDSAFCGLGGGATTSSFCVIRPSEIASGQLVPDISGNTPFRVSRTSWYAALLLSPHLAALPGLRVSVDVGHKEDVFDRQVNGLHYGERTLVGARVNLPLGRFNIELWGTNLTDQHYARVAASRQPTFYNGIPRPTDLILADGRRVGLTVQYSL